MEYRKSIQVGGQEISVRLINGCRVANGCEHIACYDRESNTIDVSTIQADGTLRHLDFINEALLHEYIEAIKEVYKVSIDEDDIDRVAQGIMHILKQYNFRFIKGDKDGKMQT